MKRKDHLHTERATRRVLAFLRAHLNATPLGASERAEIIGRVVKLDVSRLPRRIALYAIDRNGFSNRPIASMHHLSTHIPPGHDGMGILAVHRVRVSPRTLACRKTITTALHRAHHSECACADVCGHWQSHAVAVAHAKRREWLITVHHFRND